MSYTKTPASVMKNIKLSPCNTYAVQVKTKYLGTFKDRQKAIKIRDDYRAKNNMKPAEY